MRLYPWTPFRRYSFCCPAVKNAHSRSDSSRRPYVDAYNELVQDVDLYIATGRDKHGEVVEMSSDPPPANASPKEALREKLRTEAGRAVYRMKAIVEPVFGQIKEQRGFRRFSLRGKLNVSREWKMVRAVSNLLKLFRAGWVPEMA